MSETTTLKDEQRDLRAAMKAANEEADRILVATAPSEEAKAKGVHIEFKDQAQADELRAKLAEVEQIKARLAPIDAVLEGKSYLDAPDGPSAAIAALAAGQMGQGQQKTIGQLFVESQQFREKAKGQDVIFDIEGLADLGSYAKTAGKKDIYSTLPTGDQVPIRFGSIMRDPMVPLPHRQWRVRDLYNPMQTSSAIVEYFRETGFTNAASVVPERSGGAFGLKPASNLAFDHRLATARTIAHNIAVHRNTLADEPQLTSLIDSELLYGLQLHEDYQLLSGTNTGEDLPGILTDPGIQTYAWSAGTAAATGNPVRDNKADAIRRAATKTYLALLPATGVVVSVQDWEGIELTKDNNGQYLLAVSIAVGGEQRLWRLPVVDTPAMAAGTAVVGAFGLGAQLYDRELATIRTFEQHSDWAARNAVLVQAEERIAHAIKRPQSFVKVDLSTAPA